MIINVKTSLSTYDILIKNNAINEINKYIDLSHKVLIVTDDGIPCEYVNTIANQCNNHYIYTIKQGESSKSFENYQAILTYMINNNFTRSDIVIAVGGGVVGDLAGFVSSTFMRGIKFYNIPTTLLSQLDSSIGGKTAIDLNNIKNVVGSFYQPSMVIIDPNTLKTLDKRQLHSGLVEAIKMSLTSNLKLFELIKNSTNLQEDLPEIIYQAILIKKEVVEQDEKETSLRRILNFGHTIGHAIESHYQGKYLHGECVGLGMLYMSSPTVKNEISEVLNKYNLPTVVDVNVDEFISLIKHDKKATGNEINVVLVNEIGSYEIKKLPIEKLKELL